MICGELHFFISKDRRTSMEHFGEPKVCFHNSASPKSLIRPESTAMLVNMVPMTNANMLILKAQFTLKSKVHIFPLTVSAIYQS